MSNGVFQKVILQLKDITDRTFGVIDNDGCVISCTDGALLGERWTDAALHLAGCGEQLVRFDRKTFKIILSNSSYFEYAVFCTGDDD